MVAMADGAAWPAAGQPFTVEDLDRLPDDGRRYELLNGVLTVSPRPTTVHRLAATRLATLQSIACPDQLSVVAEPAMQVSDDTEFDPDIVVVRLDEAEPAPVGRRAEAHIQSACLGQASRVSTTSGGPPDSAEVAYRPR